MGRSSQDRSPEQATTRCDRRLDAHQGAASVSVEYLIICDGCGGVLSGSSKNAKAARREVALQGGTTAQPGGLDYCRGCRKCDMAPPDDPLVAGGFATLGVRMLAVHDSYQQGWRDAMHQENPPDSNQDTRGDE